MPLHDPETHIARRDATERFIHFARCVERHQGPCRDRLRALDLQLPAFALRMPGVILGLQVESDARVIAERQAHSCGDVGLTGRSSLSSR